MRDFFSLAFLAVLVCFTGLAAHMWYQSRSKPMEEAQRQVFKRFVAGIALFWVLAAIGYMMGFFSR
jgi:uncharacterized iron-regulated membrane protein